MAAIEKIRWKRLLNELIYLHEENELIKSVSEGSNQAFHEYYQGFCDRMSLDIEQLNKDNHERVSKAYGLGGSEDIEETKKALEDAHQEITKYLEPPVYSTNEDAQEEIPDNEYKMTQDEQEMHDTFNKLFRALAMKLHPDKLDSSLTEEERDAMISKFNEAKISLENRKYFVLLELASEFNVKTPRNYKQQIRWMKKESKTLRQQVDQSKATYNYLYAECETDEERDILIKKFMMQLFGIRL